MRPLGLGMVLAALGAAGAAEAQNAAAGEAVFGRCTVCHRVGAGVTSCP